MKDKNGNYTIGGYVIRIGEIILVYIILDYMNIFGFIPIINIRRINVGLLSLFVNSIIVIGGGLIAFTHVDNKNLKRMKNQEIIIKSLLKDTYEKCKIGIDRIEEMRKKNKLSSDYVDVIKSLDKSVFDSESYIMDAFVNGVLNIDYFKKYMDMKRKYKRYVLVAEGFYTDEEACNAAMVNFMITYDDGVKSLEEDLQ